MENWGLITYKLVRLVGWKGGWVVEVVGNELNTCEIGPHRRTRLPCGCHGKLGSFHLQVQVGWDS